MKKLLVLFLAIAVLVGCGTNDTEEATTDNVSGDAVENNGSEEATEETTTQEAIFEDVTFEAASLTSLSAFANSIVFDVNYVPGAHQIVDEEANRTFLVVTLPHVANGSSIEVTDIVLEDESYVVHVNYEIVEGDPTSMAYKLYELSHPMSEFVAIDQDSQYLGVTTFTNGDEVAFDSQYRTNANLNSNLLLSSPVYNDGYNEEDDVLEVAGKIVGEETVTVTLVQGDNVLGTEELTATDATQWTPFELSLSLEGVDASEGADALILQFEGDTITEEWPVQSF